MASLGCSRSDAGDCLYRIGRVTEIRPGALDQAYKDKVMAKISTDELRQIVGWETSAGKLRDKITAASTTGNVDQVHLAEIIIRNTETDQTDDPTAKDGEVHFSQILFAPNDNPDTAADLPETDPAWVKARTDADAAVAELNAITDAQARTDKFAEIAKASSDDDATKAAGGNVDFETRSLMPTNVAAALFDSQHQKADVIGPIKDETGYYVMLFDERRGTPQERLTALKADIAAGVDWNTLVTKYSDGTRRRQGQRRRHRLVHARHAEVDRGQHRRQDLCPAAKPDQRPDRFQQRQLHLQGARPPDAPARSKPGRAADRPGLRRLRQLVFGQEERG